MEYRVKLHLTTAAIVLAVGTAVSAVTSTVVAARAYRGRAEQEAQQRQTITVKGSTRQRIRSDRAVWRIRVEGRGAELVEAFESLGAAVKRVSEWLAAAGFRESDIGTDAIDTETHYVYDDKGRQTQAVAGYTLRRAFVVATADVDRAASRAAGVTELIQEGVMVFSQPPEFYFTGLSQLKIDLMASASADARARAQSIAESTGARIGPLRDAHMGVLQITQPDSTEVASYGIYDTRTIDKDVSAVVTATFGIESP